MLQISIALVRPSHVFLDEQGGGPPGGRRLRERHRGAQEHLQTEAAAAGEGIPVP